MNELFLSEDLWQTFIIEENFQRRRMPYADLKRNFIVGLEIKGSLLEMYKNPCRLKAGIFVLCLQGELKAAIHGNLWEIRKNDFIGIMPGSVIQYYQQSADLRICFVAFSSSVMESINFQQLTIDFVSVMQENPVLSLEEKTATWFKDYFHLLARANGLVKDNLPLEIVKNILQSLLCGVDFLYASHSWSKQILSRGEEIYRDVLRAVRQHYCKEHSVIFYANLLNISPQHLGATVRRVSGYTFSDILAGIVITDAKAQLRSTEFSIQEIAYSLGFRNTSFFGKYFKRYVGISPQKYREGMEPKNERLGAAENY